MSGGHWGYFHSQLNSFSEKLEEFATPTENLEEIFENKEQIEVSKFYEKLPKPHAIAIEQWLQEKVYYRHTDSDSEA